MEKTPRDGPGATRIDRQALAVEREAAPVHWSLAGRVALVTGGSRGVGAAAVGALARAGAHVVVNYRNKAARAEAVAESARALGVEAIVDRADIVDPSQVRAMVDRVGEKFGRIDLLVLNASGGMERDLVAADPAYPMRVNRDAPLDLLEAALPLIPAGAVVIHVTSHLAYFYGRIEQMPEYEPVAAGKHAGEQALRARMADLAENGIRLAVVSGDLIEDTIVPQLMDRRRPGLIAARKAQIGTLPTTADMAQAILRAAADTSLPTGATLFVGAQTTLEEPDLHQG